MKTSLLNLAFGERLLQLNVYVHYCGFLTVSAKFAVLQDVIFLCFLHIFRHLMMHTHIHISADGYCLYLCQVSSVMALPVIGSLVSPGEVELLKIQQYFSTELCILHQALQILKCSVLD